MKLFGLFINRVFADKRVELRELEAFLERLFVFPREDDVPFPRPGVVPLGHKFDEVFL